jgi:hypothetical protein
MVLIGVLLAEVKSLRVALVRMDFGHVAGGRLVAFATFKKSRLLAQSCRKHARQIKDLLFGQDDRRVGALFFRYSDLDLRIEPGGLQPSVAILRRSAERDNCFAFLRFVAHAVILAADSARIRDPEAEKLPHY